MFSVLGIDAGNGVLLHPFKKFLLGNIEPRGDFYFNGTGDQQWKLNFGEIPISKNSKPFEGEKVDIIISHPDCGNSSNLAYSRAKKLRNPKNNPSLNLFFESIQIWQPQIFMFENLPAFYKTFGRDNFLKRFPNYNIKEIIAPVSVFGNSQISRERLVIIGIKFNHKFGFRDFPLPKNPKLKTSSELIEGLEYPNPDLCHIREPLNTVVCMEKNFKKLTLKEIKDEWNSTPYKNRKKWDATTTGKGNMYNLPGVYRNLANDFPLTARKQTRQFNHNGDVMSPRELARIQGIPDDFKLFYQEKNWKTCVNKARTTATKTAPYELGYWFYKCIIKLHKKGLI